MTGLPKPTLRPVPPCAEGAPPPGRPSAAPAFDGDAAAELQALHAQLPFAIGTVDGGLRVVRANARLAALLGRAPESLAGRGLDTVAPRLHGRLAGAIGRVLGTGEPIEAFEWTGEADAGTVGARDWLARLHPVRMGGAVRGVSLSIEDVTERRRLELAVRESEDHAHAIAELGPLIQWTADPAGRVVQLSERWARTTGVPLARSLGAGWQASVHPDDLPSVRKAWTACAEGGAPYDVEHRIRIADGDWRWMRSRARARRDAQGRVVRWYGSSEDVHDAHAAREALRESEAFLRGVADVAPCILYVHELAADRNVWSNGEMTRLLGYRREDLDALSGRVLATLMHPDDLGRLVAEHLPAVRALADGRTAEFEYRMRASDGGWRWLLSRDMVSRRDARGEPLEIVGAALDITARRRAEDSMAQAAASLRRERERLDVALRAGRFGAYEWRVGGSAMWWSRETYTLFGVDPDTFVPTIESFDAMLHPDDRGALWRHSEARLRTGEPFEHEYRIVRPDGSVRWMRNQSHSIMAADGTVERTTGVVADVTERRLADEALREAEKRLRLSTQAGNIGIWEWDVRRDVVVWSDRVHALHDLAPGTFGGSSADFVALIHPDDRERVGAKLQAALDAGTPYVTEFRTLLPGGGERWLSTWASIEAGPDGAPARMVGATISIDAYKRVEAALRDSDRRKDEFIAMLSHELRNPMAPLRNALRLLEREPLTPVGRDVLRMGARQVGHLGRLVDDLLEVSRITRGKIELRREPVCLPQLLRNVVQPLVQTIEERGQRLEVELPDAVPSIDADPLRVAQIAENLLSNASKYTDRGGRIALRLACLGDEVEITVADTGIGFDPADAQRLFELFGQLDVSIDRARGGLGIGLALVRQLAELHGGRVRADSPGRGLGATFSVTLPVRLTAARTGAGPAG